MKIDLKKMSAADLAKLALDVEQRQATLKQETLQSLLEKMTALADKQGVDFDDVIELYSGSKPKKKAKAKSPAKYRNPDDLAQTWTGRGRKPGWLIAKLQGGEKLESFAI